jgi:hypothetical protein
MAKSAIIKYHLTKPLNSTLPPILAVLSDPDSAKNDYEQ